MDGCHGGNAVPDYRSPDRWVFRIAFDYGR